MSEKIVPIAVQGDDRFVQCKGLPGPLLHAPVPAQSMSHVAPLGHVCQMDEHVPSPTQSTSQSSPPVHGTLIPKQLPTSHVTLHGPEPARQRGTK